MTSGITAEGLQELRAKVQANASRYCEAIDRVMELVTQLPAEPVPTPARTVTTTVDPVEETTRARVKRARVSRPRPQAGAKPGRRRPLRDVVTEIVRGWSGEWTAGRLREAIAKEHPEYVRLFRNLHGVLILLVDRGELIRTGVGREAKYEKTTKLGHGETFGRMSAREQEYRKLRSEMGIQEGAV